MDPYKVFGMTPPVSLTQLRSAFRQKAWQSHPDQGGSEVAMQEILQAFEMLSATMNASEMLSTVGPTSQQEPLRVHGNVDLYRIQGRSTNIGCPGVRRLRRILAAKIAGRPGFPQTAQLRKTLAVGVPTCKLHLGATFRGGAVIRQIHRILECLDPRQRRAVIREHFSQVQRLALERWMLHRPRSSHACRGAHVLDSYTKRKRPFAVHASEFVCTNRVGPGRISRPTAFGPADRPTVPHSVVAAASDAGPAPTGSCKRAQNIVRIIKRIGGQTYQYYLASTVLGGLQVFSRADPKLEVAIEYHMALTFIRQRTMAGLASTETPTSQADRFEKSFRKAVASTLPLFGMTAKSIGLKLVVCLKALWVKAPLRTPPYSVAANLDAGLAAWRRLGAARGRVPRRRNYVLRQENRNKTGGGEVSDIVQSWRRLRDEYLNVMTDAGVSRVSVLRRLEGMEQERRQRGERQSERWNRQQMAAEEQLQRSAANQSIHAKLDASHGDDPLQNCVLQHLKRLLASWRKPAAGHSAAKRYDTRVSRKRLIDTG